MQRSGLVAAVKDYLNRANVQGVSLSYMIESVEGELNRALRYHPRNQTRVVSQLTSDVPLTVPDDLLTLAQLRYVTGTTQVPYTQFPYNMREEAKAYTNAFINRGTQLELFHASTIVYPAQMVLDYFKALPTVAPDTSAPTLTNWVLQYYADVYLYGVLKEAAIYVKDKESIPVWVNEFNTRLESLVMQGAEMRTANSPQVMLVK